MQGFDKFHDECERLGKMTVSLEELADDIFSVLRYEIDVDGHRSGIENWTDVDFAECIIQVISPNTKLPNTWLNEMVEVQKAMLKIYQHFAPITGVNRLEYNKAISQMFLNRSETIRVLSMGNMLGSILTPREKKTMIYSVIDITFKAETFEGTCENIESGLRCGTIELPEDSNFHHDDVGAIEKWVESEAEELHR